MAEEREKRVEELYKKSAKRMGNQGILRGWTAWHDKYEDHVRQKQMLASAGGRLLRPKLAASLAHWRVLYEASVREREEAAAAERIAQAAGVKKDLEAARAELEKLRAGAAAERRTLGRPGAGCRVGDQGVGAQPPPQRAEDRQDLSGLGLGTIK